MNTRGNGIKLFALLREVCWRKRNKKTSWKRNESRELRNEFTVKRRCKNATHVYSSSRNGSSHSPLISAFLKTKTIALENICARYIPLIIQLSATQTHNASRLTISYIWEHSKTSLLVSLPHLISFSFSRILAVFPEPLFYINIGIYSIYNFPHSCILLALYQFFFTAIHCC